MLLPKPDDATQLYLLTGPTATGKSTLAIAWALRYEAEVVSCDAFLFYQGADIGTAKPSLEERQGVVHHGIDLVSADTSFDIGQYTAWAKALIPNILNRNKRVLIVGGSGFYLQSFFRPMIDPIVIPEALEADVKTLYAQEGLAGLLAALKQAQPGNALNLESFIDVKNPRRVQNALLRCLASGLSLPELIARWKALPQPFSEYKKQLWVLDHPDLKMRIEQRIDGMLAQGLVGEVRHLLKNGINKSLATAIGYREPIAYLQGSLHAEALAPTLLRNTCRLVKKQRTWLCTQVTNYERLRGAGAP